MQNLSLTEIAPYPEGLKAVCPKGYIIEIFGLNYRHKGILNSLGQMTFKIEEIKPILYDISHLTKPMDDGSVPIQILAKMAFPKKNWNNKAMCRKDLSLELYHFYFSKGAFVMRISEKVKVPAPNQLALFQKMAEMKIDFQDLIGQGKAIDATTLQVNPYL